MSVNPIPLRTGCQAANKKYAYRQRAAYSTIPLPFPTRLETERKRKEKRNWRRPSRQLLLGIGIQLITRTCAYVAMPATMQGVVTSVDFRTHTSSLKRRNYTTQIAKSPYFVSLLSCMFLAFRHSSCMDSLGASLHIQCLNRLNLLFFLFLIDFPRGLGAMKGWEKE